MFGFLHQLEREICKLIPKGRSVIITNANKCTYIYIYRVYQKKVDNFETALNLVKRLQV